MYDPARFTLTRDSDRWQPLTFLQLLLYTPSLRKEPNLTCFLKGV